MLNFVEKEAVLDANVQYALFMEERKEKPIIEKKDIQSIFRIFLKNWYILVFFVGVGLIIGNLIIQRSVNKYQITTSVLVKNEEQENLAEAVVKSLGFNRRAEDLANELQIINSTELISKVVDKMDLDVSYYIKGRFSAQECYHSLPFTVKAEIANPKFYTVDFNLRVLDARRFILEYQLANQPMRSFKGVFGQPLQNKNFSLLVSASDKFKRRDITTYRATDYFFRVNNRKNLVAKYKKSVTAKDLDWTSIIEISLTDALPERGVNFLDTLTAVYIESAIETRKARIDTTISFIDTQIRDVVEILNSKEKDLEDYKRSNVNYDITAETNNYLAKITEFDVQIRQNELMLKSLADVKRYLSKSISDTSLFTPPYKYTTNDLFLSEGLASVYETLLKLQGQRLSRKKDNMEYRSLVSQLNYLVSNLIAYSDNTSQTLIKLNEGLAAQRSTYEAKISRMPVIERELVNYQRLLDVNQQMYEFLLQKRSEFVIRKSGVVSGKKLVEPAKMMALISPNRSAIINYALGLSVALALLLIFIRRTFFDTIDTAFDLKNQTDVPLIGVVNRDKEGRNSYLLVESKPRSVISESFRSIRNNLEYLATETDHKVILITSSLVSEGKTFTSINLATILAKAGRRTIILEFDLHKPKVQKAFDMSNEKGITTILIGKNNLSECIKQSPIENLDVLVSGPIPPNSSELILHGTMSDLFKELRAQYDFIVMDTPPVGILSDALILMRFADINLYVIKAYAAKTSFIDNLHHIRDNYNPKNLGVILNGVKGPGGMRYKYGSGYTVMAMATVMATATVMDTVEVIWIISKSLACKSDIY